MEGGISFSGYNTEHVESHEADRPSAGGDLQVGKSGCSSSVGVEARDLAGGSGGGFSAARSSLGSPD